jgi:exodeoxyribonuclease V beta subunit
LKAQGLDPDSLKEVYRKKNALAEAVLQPGADEVDETIVTQVLDAWQEVKTGWQRDEDEVTRLLYDAPQLCRNKENFKHETLATLLYDAGRAVAHDDAGHEAFQKLSRSHISAQTKKKKTSPSHPFFDVCERLQSLVPSLTAYMRRRAIAYVERRSAGEKLRQGRYSYGDLLEDVHRGVCRNGGDNRLVAQLRRHYRAVCIDEFQDTDVLQYEIFTTVFHGSAHLFFIGDPKQAIYSFRGADIFTYRRATRLEGIRRYSLDVNHRSHPRLIRAFNTIFDIQAPFVYDWISYRRVQAAPGDHPALCCDGTAVDRPFVIWNSTAQTNKTEAESLGMTALQYEIPRLIDQGRQGRATVGADPLCPRDIAVLVHKNTQAQAVKEALRERGVTSVIAKSDNVFHSDEAKDMVVLLGAIESGIHPSTVRAALLTPVCGYTTHTLETLEADETAWEEMLRRFKAYARLWHRRGVMTAVSELLDEFDAYTTLLATARAQRAVTNIRHILEVLHTHEHETACGPYELRVWLQQRIHSDETVPDEYELRLESDSDAVQILTVHRSKGLQFPVVFYPFMSDPPERIAHSDETYAVYHDNEHEAPVLALDVEKGGPRKQRQAREAMAENYRAFYVALTRAVHRCYAVCFPRLMYKKKQLPVASVPNTHFLARFVSRPPAPSSGIELRAFPADPVPVRVSTSRDTDAAAYRQPCRFSGRIPGVRRVTSFTHLTRGIHSGTAASVQTARPRQAGQPGGGGDGTHEAVQPPPDSVAAMGLFPRGPTAGTALHEMINRIDFTGSRHWDEVITWGLNTYNIRDEQEYYHKTVHAMLQRLTATELQQDRPGLSLSRLHGPQRHTELEFFLRSDTIDRTYLQSVLDEHTAVITPHPVHGVVHGFIDLLFCADDTFYLVDWKSNYLGPDADWYTPPQLFEAMKEHNYFFQYHLYTLAVHRYLTCFMKDYAYGRHFGGVFYVFLRGITADPQDRSGVYFDRPDEDRLAAMERAFYPGDTARAI